MGGAPSTVLAHDLYWTLLWQALVVVVVAMIAAILLRSRFLGQDLSFEPRARRVLRMGLGGLWLVSALLLAQPGMAAALVPSVLNPAAAVAPPWSGSLLALVSRVSLLHPVAFNAAAIWLAAGLGLALLGVSRGRSGRFVAGCAMAWALLVWVFGEGLGGVFGIGGSLLRGSPGAALGFAAAAGLLLLPWSQWESGIGARWARNCVGGVFILSAVLQALPVNGFWRVDGFLNLFSAVARGGLPRPLAQPVQDLGIALTNLPGPANAMLVLVLASLGVGLLIGAAPRALSVAAGVIVGFAWWFGQGFAIFGGSGTSVGIGGVLLMLLVAGWPRPAGAVAAPIEQVRSPSSDQIRHLARVGLATLAVVSLVLGPLLAIAVIAQQPAAQAAIADSGGVTGLPPDVAPDFTLTDQLGRSVELSSLRGSVVVISFMDPVCFDNCPLMANQLATALRLLGPAAKQVQLVAIDVNPTFNHVADVATFTQEHLLSNLTNWHFVTGTIPEVGKVLADYGQGVSIPQVGMVGHPQTVFVIDKDGRARSMLADSANENLTSSYSQLLAHELRKYL